MWGNWDKTLFMPASELTPSKESANVINTEMEVKIIQADRKDKFMLF